MPKLKNHCAQTSTEKDIDTPQKEKLTLKFIRTSDVNKSAEKTSKLTEKERHPLYRVLSKADSETEPTKGATRRNTIDSQKSSKSARRSRLQSETSESNVSVTESLNSLSHKKTPRGPGKRKKKTVEQNLEEPDPKRLCPPASLVDDVEEQLLEEIPTPKSAKRVRNRSRSTIQNEEEMPLVVTVGNAKIPAGTDEIHTLREDSTTNLAPRTKNRSRSLHRTKSHEKDPNDKKTRRSSAHPTSGASVETEELFRPEVSLLRRRLSQASSTSTALSKGGNSSRQRSLDAPSAHEFPQILPIEVKSEPPSDIEEVVETNQVTVSNIEELVADNGGKRKTILITSDNSNDSHAIRLQQGLQSSVSSSSRSGSRENSQARSQNPMVYIPHVFATNSEENSARNINGHTSAPSSRRNSRHEATTTALPRLIPKPSGVFTQDGTNFQLETGAVSALFSENAHRMTDYFKSLLIDTIGAVSSGIPTAEITLLRLENEKLKQHAQKTKNEHNLTIERMKKEHMDEIRVLRNAYGEMVNLLISIFLKLYSIQMKN